MKLEGDRIDNNNPLILECGTSLAEREHREDGDGESAKGEPSSFDSIGSLRTSVANDVVSTQRQYTTFSSPFESVHGATALESRRFLEVPLIYTDQTASNRPLQSVESYIQKTCLPLYGNTHTNTSITGSQSTAFVAEARQIVAEETNAKVTGKASLDVVLFAGNGATATVELLIDCLGLKHASNDQSSRPVVFIGPYEHHSNLVPWRETGCEIVMVPERSDAVDIDFDALARLLSRPEYKARLKMGTFSAASNVTGKISDVDRIAAVLHKHGALAFFDYATGASYMKMDMNPPPSDRFPSPGSTTKDAIFISPHKMIGGVGTPGVLIIKKHLVNQSNAPHRSGGGTVFYVTSQHHRFLGNRIERYEGGTPNVSGIVRAGITFLAKRKIEKEYERLISSQSGQTNGDLPRSLEEFDCAEYERISAYLGEHAPNLVLLGKGTGSRHLPIFSFLVKFQNRFLHFNYVCAILNDVFGIQSRGGCMCSGPYAQSLLGLTDKNQDGLDVPNEFNKDIEDALIKHKERAELLRPGLTRLSLPFKGLLEIEVEYVLQALIWVAKHGWALMCQYRCNHRTGEWRHFNRQGKPLGREERKWLSHFDLNADKDFGKSRDSSAEEYASLLKATLVNADNLLDAAKADQRSIAQALKMMDYENMSGEDADKKLDSLRWYAYPKECAMLLTVVNEGTDQLDKPLVGAINPLCGAKRNLTEQRESKTNSRLDGDLTPRPDVTTKKRKVEELVSISSNGEKVKTNNNEKKGPRDITTWGKGEIAPVVANLKDTSLTSAGITNIKEPLARDNKFKHIKPPAKMMRLITQAIVQWDMIKEGDKLLLGLSGGKDSLSLLHALLEVRRRHPVKFELEVCTIDPMTPSFDPSSLIPYVESMGLKYHYIRDDIVSRATSSGKDGKMVSSLCAFCARMKRGNLYSCARKNNCNKLVLAQHLDDCAESFMMSVMHNGFLRTMKANYKVNAGDLSVIRPMVYCRESLMTEFAKTVNLPIINENCPACFEEPKERARVKKLLSREENLYPNFYDNIRRSLLPLMHDDATSILRCYTDEVVSKSRRNNKDMTDSVDHEDVQSSSSALLGKISDDDLVKELARRKADRFRLSGSMKRIDDHMSGISDPTGQMCSLNGGNGTIPCAELME